MHRMAVRAARPRRSPSPPTRAEKRLRREVRRAARKAQHALVTFVLAWGAGELDTWPYERLERERRALLAAYREARGRERKLLRALDGVAA